MDVVVQDPRHREADRPPHQEVREGVAELLRGGCARPARGVAPVEHEDRLVGVVVLAHVVALDFRAELDVVRARRPGQAGAGLVASLVEPAEVAVARHRTAGDLDLGQVFPRAVLVDGPVPGAEIGEALLGRVRPPVGIEARHVDPRLQQGVAAHDPVVADGQRVLLGVVEVRAVGGDGVGGEGRPTLGVRPGEAAPGGEVAGLERVAARELVIDLE